MIQKIESLEEELKFKEANIEILEEKLQRKTKDLKTNEKRNSLDINRYILSNLDILYFKLKLLLHFI